MIRNIALFTSRSIKLGFLLCVMVLITAIVHLESRLPSVDVLKDVQLQVPLKIYTADHKLIAEYGEKRRTPVSLNDVPKNLINAIVATEDRRFYQHPGVDFRGIARALVTLATKGTKEQGGSTITMQVARNFFLSRKKTYIRKISEILLAFKIEQELTKDEILELYINKIYLGKRAYGVAAAAEVYYGTTVDKLDLSQMAMIAGLPQAPSAINPINAPQAATKRRNHVLDRMLHYGFIKEEDYWSAINTPLVSKYHGRQIEVYAPYVAEMVRQELMERYSEDIYDRGYEIITTIDSKMQTAANMSLVKGLREYDQRHGYRGPIKQLTKYRTLHDINSKPESLAPWLEELNSIPQVHDVVPAIVNNFIDNDVEIILPDGSLAVIEFKSGISWVNLQYKKQDSAAKIKDPKKIIKIGDVILATRLDANHWQLTQHPEVEAAIVAMSPDNGKILSLVGGYNFNQSSFNRATQATRQPGSSLKPFIYGAALENGFTNASIINDAPIVQEDPSQEQDWRPQNHTRKFYGPTRLRTGITHSRNLVSIRLLQATGIDKAVDFMQRCGLKRSNLNKSLSLALGTNLLTPLELAASYSVFPNGGYKIDPFFIDKINDYNGNSIYTSTPKLATSNIDAELAPFSQAPRAISPQISYLVTSLLQDVITTGTGRKAIQLGRRDIAGKTGTTNDQFDGWYAGFNRDIVATTWIGYDEPKSLQEYAVNAALPMWMYFMEQALKGKPESSPPQPSGLVTVKIDPHSGLLARSGQADSIYEIFTEDTVPNSVAPLYKGDNHSEIDGEGNVTLEMLF